MTHIILKHSNGSKAGLRETFTIDLGTHLSIGRGRGHDVVFNSENEVMVSRAHCRIVRDKYFPDQYYMEDIGSMNGTYINNSLIHKKTPLKTGDIITIGKNGPKIEFGLDPRPA